MCTCTCTARTAATTIREGTAPLFNFTISPALLTLPAGSYVVHFDFGVQDSGTAGEASCLSVYPAAADAPDRYGTTFYTALPDGVGVGSASITEPLTVTSSTQVEVQCTSGLAGIFFDYFDVTVTRTGSLAASGFAPN
jgi:hypothetical protein